MLCVCFNRLNKSHSSAANWLICHNLLKKKKNQQFKKKKILFYHFLSVGWFLILFAYVCVCVCLLSNVNEMVCSSELYTIFVLHNRIILFYCCCWGKNVHFQEYSIRVTHTGRRRRCCRLIWRAQKKKKWPNCMLESTIAYWTSVQ